MAHAPILATGEVLYGIRVLRPEQMVNWVCSMTTAGGLFTSARSNSTYAYAETETVKKRGDEWIGEFTCPLTNRAARFVSLNRGSSDRAIRHFMGRHASLLSNLERGGVPKERLGEVVGWAWDGWVAESLVEFDREEKVFRSQEAARTLLERCLTPSQRDTWNVGHYFDVVLADGGKKWKAGTYRIRKEHSFNVEHLASREKFCVVATEPVPIYDQLLTQKLLLENEPAKFFAKANRYGVFGEVGRATR